MPSRCYAAYTIQPWNHKGARRLSWPRRSRVSVWASAGEGQNTAHHQAKKMDHGRAARHSVTASTSRCQRQGNRAIVFLFTSLPADSPEMEYMLERRERPQADSCPSAARESLDLVESTGTLETFKTQLDGTGEREASTTMAFVRMLTALDARQANWQTRRSDRSRRSAHLRHGRHVPSRSASTAFKKGQLYEPDGCRRAHVLPRGQEGPDPRGRHQRGGAYCSSWIAAGYVVFESRRPDDSVLHLLLDVRISAYRRSSSGQVATSRFAAS